MEAFSTGSADMKCNHCGIDDSDVHHLSEELEAWKSHTLDVIHNEYVSKQQTLACKRALEKLLKAVTTTDWQYLWEAKAPRIVAIVKEAEAALRGNEPKAD